MENALFLQSDLSNPYDFYKRMRAEQPVFWDEKNQIWAIYSYNDCYYLLNSNLVEIPKVSTTNLNNNATTVIENLARLNNLPHHAKAREAAFYLFEKLKSIPTPTLLNSLLRNMEGKPFDFVETIGKKLPALTLLKGFGFGDSEIELILPKVPILVQLMIPNKTENQISIINEAIDDVFLLVEKHLTTSKAINKEEPTDIYVSNLIGLLIQSYDAGRGLLSNALLQTVSVKNDFIKIKNNLEKSIIEVCLKENFINMNGNFLQAHNDRFNKIRFLEETVRFDSPLQNTRRILTENIILRDKQLEKGQQILLVLASANRDQLKFENPDQFNINRRNNNESLTFGTGIHSCLAKYFSISLVSEVLDYFLNTYKNIHVIDEEIQYEPLVNVRLAKRIQVTISKH